MKQLGNLAMVCAQRPEVLMQIYDGEVSVHVGSGPKRTALHTSWNNDAEISRIIHELNFGAHALQNTCKETDSGKCKQQALAIVNRLRRENHMRSGDYAVLCDSLSGIESPQDRDEVLELLWEQLEDIPMDPVTECIETPFLSWGPGTHREEIWRWFDKWHSKGVVYLLYSSNASKQGSHDGHSGR